MTFLKTLAAGALLATALSTGAVAADIKPAVIFDMGGKFDKSFNEAAYRGAEAFKEKTGVAYREFEVTNPSQREQAMRNFARRGMSPIIGIGFAQAAAMEKVAQEFPDTQFAIVDMVVDQPNVRSIVFKEHEGSYLVGMLAAMASETGKIGFVGGMDIPLISKFSCGYKQGAHAVNGDITVYSNMTGTTPAAWNDPVKGGELAKSQFARGADIVFHAAGSTGLGVLQAAADEGKYAIGVDSNQNHLHPGSILTSMVKRVDVAVEQALIDASEGNFDTGIQSLGLAEDGVGYSMDEFNAELVSAEMAEAVEAARADIISGEIVVHDYMADNACPM
ncbi:MULTISPECIES: BMP family lipoprotein [Pseudovibrio]|uniref:BMP family lipoprotein n=1 Tax=Stappiaceae TaxID=2821832 RepID=UPI0023650ACE|nr:MULTISPECIES: BMP family ABC transporter substrate-binding protein [Pseudovibrio]MDD7910732.1 BMP family ABC transporter substrate-binding protein [Pseudovibrio exalbescens]MDX5595734.1 BMP family ABC transporter substrate-binding protein [Pseudovibrio sp. SPO723]